MKVLDLGGNAAAQLRVHDATTLATPAGHPDLRVEDLTVTGTAVVTSTVTATGGMSTAAQAGVVVGPFGAGAGNTGELRFLELAAGGTNYVGFKAADALAGNTVYTLPTAFPASDMVLQSTSAGVLSWVAAGGGGANTALSNLAAVAINTPLLIGGGSKTAPSYSFTGLTNIGLYTTGANNLSFAIDGSVRFSMSQTGGFRLGSGVSVGWLDSTETDSGTTDVFLARLAPGSLRLGGPPEATPDAQIFTIGEASRPGTDTDVGGASGTIRSGLGTGTGAGSTVTVETPDLVASGSGTQAYVARAVFGGATPYANFTGNDDSIGSSIDAATGLRLGSGKVVNWSSTTAFDGTADVGLERNAAGVLEVTDGSTGLGALLVRATDGVRSLMLGSSSWALSEEYSHIWACLNNSPYLRGWSATADVAVSGWLLQWSSHATDASNVKDTTVYRAAANIVGFSGATSTALGGIQPTQSANGGQIRILTAEENLTLSTSGNTTDTAANLLPAGALILTVTGRVTTTITTATDWQLGDPTTAGRFTTPNATMTAGTTDIGRVHATTGIASATTGMYQSSAAKVRVTTTGTPGAGAVRITVHYILLTPPTG